MTPSVALIINTYNQPDYLQRVLAGVERQSIPPEQVLVADDGSEPATRQLFQKWSAEQSVSCAHVWQKNEGFRRARILNRTIASATADYIVFLDGDSVPHPDFIRDHKRMARPGFFVQGHRSLVGEKAAAYFGKDSDLRSDRYRALLSFGLNGIKHAFRWPLPLTSTRSDLRGIRGCNLAIWKEDLAKVNGYNEAFTGWGREDSELAVRLMNSGVRRLDVRGRAICFHLWHPPAKRDGLANNDRLLQEAQAERANRCRTGLDQYLAPAS